MAMGELDAEIPGAVHRKRLSRASARKVMEDVGDRRLAYTTINRKSPKRK
jgi:hypothetical protein